MDSYTKTFNDSMLPSIPDESMFQPNPSDRQTQPILQDEADVPQEARDCLNTILKDNCDDLDSIKADVIA